jgi:hypothetical protein
MLHGSDKSHVVTLHIAFMRATSGRSNLPLYLVGKEHGESVDAGAPPARGGQRVLQRQAEVLVVNLTTLPHEVKGHNLSKAAVTPLTRAHHQDYPKSAVDKRAR